MKKINWHSREGVILLDALHNCSAKLPDKSEVGVVYGRGVLVGLVAGLMYSEHYFDEAWEQILRRVEVDPRCIPMYWPTLADYDEVHAQMKRLRRTNSEEQAVTTSTQPTDQRTLTGLAREALQIQDASNLSGLVHGWSRSVSRLRELLPEAGTAEINRHPINQLWAAKLCDLLGMRLCDPEKYGEAYDECKKLTD